VVEFTITRHVFHPENEFSGFLDPKTQIKTPNSSLQNRSMWSYVGHKDAAAILDAILNYTFLPHIWNVYPSFFQSPMCPLQGSKVKIRGHIIAHRTPSAPGLYCVIDELKCHNLCSKYLPFSLTQVCMCHPRHSVAVTIHYLASVMIELNQVYE